jgi:DNA-binding LacI/PurR family transcriptional regulator
MGDVAAAAGVSHQTVSRVLNDARSVREPTRQRVLAAMLDLGYRRNPAARALATRRSQTLGVIGSHTTFHGPASILYAVERSAREAGYLVSVVSERTVDGATLRRAVERLDRQAVEGLVVVGPLLSTAEAVAQLPPEVPVVVVEGAGEGDLPAVRLDQRGGARRVTRHLLERGAATVWHVAGPREWREARAREAGWREELEAAGAEVPETLGGDWSAASGWAAGRVLAARADVEAVFVANDQMALGVLRALAEGGRRVPEDVLVAGFDDVPEAAYYGPPLTTVRQDFDAVGRRSVQLLIERVTGEEDAEELPALPLPELVVRRSTERTPGPALGRPPGGRPPSVPSVRMPR